MTRNKALCLHVTKWLYLRLEQRLHDSDEAKARIECAFRVLFSPFGLGLRRVRIHQDEGYVEVEDAGDGKQGGIVAAGAFDFMHNESRKLALVAIDEAHHIHEQGDLQQIVDKYAPKGQSLTRLMLLSDASQSGAIEMAHELGATEVRLEEVVRSTQRIIAGAAMFGKTGHGVVASHQVTRAILY